MKVFIALIAMFCIAAVPASGSEPSGSSTNADIGAATKAVESFHAALASGHAEEAKSLLDERVSIYEQGWVEHSRAEYSDHHLTSDIAFSKATTTAVTSRTGALIGDLAYVVSESKVTGQFEGKAIDSITLETMVLRKQPEGWRIVHIHWSSRKAK